MRLLRMLPIGTAVITLTACTASTVVVGPKAAPVAKPSTYVAIGGDDSIGAGSDDPLLDAWTADLLPHRAPTLHGVHQPGRPAVDRGAGHHRSAPRSTRPDAQDRDHLARPRRTSSKGFLRRPTAPSFAS